MALQLRLAACIVAVAFAVKWSPWTPPQSQCLQPNGTLAPCEPGNQICNGANGPPGPFGRNTPQFHVRDKSCGINDPVSPVYDPVHGVYHLHYENHVGLHGGYTHGHAVSRDFVHWAHMPIDIWNDQPYDEFAIFTGSATVVDGKVVQVYPGLCKGADCPGATNLCIAVPADPSDPLHTNWSKTWAKNPVVNNTQRDPSTAWQTSHGEWRLTTYDTQMYGSMDFKTWYSIGAAPGFAHGECPSFFPLPRTTPGAGPAANASTPSPTHVHKASHEGGDWMCVGTYDEGAVKTTGTFTATTGIAAGLKETNIDRGALYASKDFYDPVKKRRINWGWAQVHPASTQSLPREVTWHPELQQLVFSPVEEQAKLREQTIGQLTKTALGPTHPMASLGLPKWVGNTSEVIVSFDRPSTTVQLGVKVMVGTSPGYAKWEAGWNFPGADYEVNSSETLTQNCTGDGKCPCQARCEADGIEKCKSWTLVPTGAPSHAGNPRCCLKNAVPNAAPYPGIVSGVNGLNPGHTGTPFTVDYVHDLSKISSVKVHGGPYTDTLQLLPSDKTIDIRLFVDNTMTEAYWMGGRVAMTVDTPATEDADVVVSMVGKNAPTVSVTATAWSVSPIWVTPAEVLRTPRADGYHTTEWEHFV